MSKKIKRNRKFNSDNDSLTIGGIEGPATTGPVPYDDFYDYGPNGIHHIMSYLDYYDKNYCADGPNEPLSLFEVYKL